jgi:hypothetical protein
VISGSLARAVDCPVGSLRAKLTARKNSNRAGGWRQILGSPFAEMSTDLRGGMEHDDDRWVNDEVMDDSIMITTLHHI